MIKEIVIKDKDLFITTELDPALFEKKYPQLYDKYKDELEGMSLWDAEEIIPETDLVEELVAKEEAVLLFFDDGSMTPIYNTELIKFSSTSFDGFSVFADSSFVYFVIIIASGQGGSLGIWSLAEKEWVFTHRDNDFCVGAITFLPKSNCFVGFSEYYNYTNPGGDSLFFINSNRGYTDMVLNELEGFDWASISLDAREELSLKLGARAREERSLNQDAAIVFDQIQSALYTIRGSERRAYRLDETQISTLQHQATLPGF